MIYIFADGARASLGIAVRMNIPRSGWKAIHSEEDLYGTTKPCVLIAWDANRRRDYDRIIEALQARDAWIWTETTR